ncbi:MAG: glutaredoxin 3 [Deltaproteobacteria bacterium]|nr:glutaredoxin 3 [Deltaproteobacteria bacterium]
MTITLYTTDYCGYCRAAKRLLAERGLAFTEIDVTNNAAERAAVSARADGWRTVPMVFIDERFIGGYQELLALDQAGQLLPGRG